MNERICLGLDVSKAEFEACLLIGKKKDRSTFPNSPSGFKKLLSWLHGLEKDRIHACLEPTGVYSKALAKFLYSMEIKVSQVNSFAVQSLARGKNFRSKTDRIDAYLLADYCLKEDPPTWRPPTQIQEELKELNHRLSTVDEDIRKEKNRLETVDSKVVLEDIEDSLGRLMVRREKLERAIRALIRSDEVTTKNFAILNSIIGIGEKSAIRLLAAVRFDTFESGRQVGCYAGLTPRDFESGSSIRKRASISKVGSSEIRGYMYFPAMVAIQHNPQLREFAERLEGRNKLKKVIIVAVMRKLLALATTLIRKQQFYDPEFCSFRR
jgi:transposase